MPMVDCTFGILDGVPKGLNTKSFDRAVINFTLESNCKDNRQGLANQTLENIASILIYKTPGQFVWATVEENEVVAYALTHVSKDVDNTFCYYMTQAWLHPKYRNTGYAKECLRRLRQHGKDLMCRHIVIPSSRNTKAYLRFLGSPWHEYVTLLKEDI